MSDYDFVPSRVPVYPHHSKQTVSGSRAKYREGKKDTAVKVYTVNQESVYIIITGVPAVGASEELRGICDQYGIIEDFRPVDDYPSEQFTEVFLVKYQYFPAARAAKKCLDDRSFFGGNLHVFYAPEFESVEETRLKLQERRKYVAWKTKQGYSFAGNASTNSNHWSTSFSNNRNTSSSSSHKNHEPPQKPVTYIWAGKEYTIFPESSSANETQTQAPRTQEPFLPRQLQHKKVTDNTDCHYGAMQPYAAGYGVKRLYAGADTSKQNSLSSGDTSYSETVSNIRTKLLHVAVPNTRISLKRKRRL